MIRISNYGKRVIDVRAIEGRLYMFSVLFGLFMPK